MLRRSTNQLDTPAQKGCAIGFFAIFALVGLAVGLGLGYALLGTVQPYFWAPTPCTIVDSQRIEPGVESTKGRTFVIRYRYRFNGGDYTSDQFSAGIQESLSTSKIERLLLTHPVGSESRCYVNPKNPSEAVLNRTGVWVAFFLLIPGIFFTIGVGGIISTLRSKKGPAAIGQRTPKQSSGHAASLVVLGVFGLVGGALTWFFGVSPVLTWQAAKSWPATPCEILSSSVGVHHSSGKNSSTTYSTDIVYRYRIGGREFRSDRVSLFMGSSSGREGKENTVARYRAGSAATCYVNPQDPLDTLLDRSLPWFVWLALIPALIFLGCLSGIFNTLRKMIRESGTVGEAGGIAPPSLPGVPPTLPGAAPSLSTTIGGPAVLTPRHSPMAKFIGAIFITLFWNGIVSVFVVMAVKSWMRGNPEIFLSLFMLPFVAIGLALAGFLMMTFLNLFNPRIALAVNSQQVPLGGTLEVRWNFRGAVSRLQRLKIFLEGREEARYRRGTRDYTDREVFARLPIVETDDPQRIREGQTQFIVPPTLMHSWESVDNKIVWELKVAGEIPRYPDVDEEFTFTVLPRAL